MAQIPVVNEKDKIICYKDRKDIKQEDIYRVSALWVTNSKGEILLAKRALTKKNDPGKWGPAVAGTVEKGETYKQNIAKETYEELGLQNVEFRKGPKLRVYSNHNHFTQWYFLTLDRNIREFKIAEKEVEEIRWFSKNQIKKENKNIFLNGMNYWIENF
jgi:isopentenyldiphosphate isomerase